LRRLRRRLPQNTRIEFQSLSGFRMPCKFPIGHLMSSGMQFQSLSGFRMPCKLVRSGRINDAIIEFQSLSGFRMPCKGRPRAGPSSKRSGFNPCRVFGCLARAWHFTLDDNPFLSVSIPVGFSDALQAFRILSCVDEISVSIPVGFSDALQVFQDSILR